MSGNNKRHVVLGAGPLGTVLARQLKDDGQDVQLLSIMNVPAYNMPGPKPETIDGSDPEQVREVCEGASAVYLCLNAHYVDWYELFPPRLDAAIEVAAATGA